MLFCREQFEVLNAVISSVVVAVVDVLIREELTAKGALHDKTVFEYILAAVPFHTIRIEHEPVSLGIDVAPAPKIWIQRSCPASHGISNSGNVAVDIPRNPAGVMMPFYFYKPTAFAMTSILALLSSDPCIKVETRHTFPLWVSVWSCGS
jgi:hypothetical protein